MSKAIQSIFAATFVTGEALSNKIDLGGYRPVGLSLPATLPESTSITVLTSTDGVTFVPVYGSDGVEKVLTVAPSRRVIMSPGDFYGLRWIQLRLGTAAAPVNAAAGRTINIVGEA